LRLGFVMDPRRELPAAFTESATPGWAGMTK
jgi:hypothetical protein